MSVHHSNNVQVTKIAITYEISGSTERVVSLPTFSPESGTTFTESLDVTLSAESGCDIYYTTDDTEPTTSSTKYTSPIKLTESKTIKAIANNGTKSSEVATATYTKVEPTGTFTLHTGELIEGDYVIYYSGKAMKAVVSSNRLGYEEVTPSGNEIVDPLAATIWHIAPSGDNWTVYNNNKGYAAGTGTKSQAGLVANLTGDNANKAAWTVTASGNAYEFVNVYNHEKNHLEMHICEELNIDPHSEEAAVLSGTLAKCLFSSLVDELLIYYTNLHTN